MSGSGFARDPGLHFTAVAAQTVLVPELRSAVRNSPASSRPRRCTARAAPNLATKVRPRCPLWPASAPAQCHIAALVTGWHAGPLMLISQCSTLRACWSKLLGGASIRR